MLAAATSLLIGLVAGPFVIRRLTELKIGQAIRSEGPQSHLVKSGTPTMGGALILISIAATTLLWADLSNRFIWIVLLVTLAFGAIGWVDDYRKVVHRDPKGMSSRREIFVAVGGRRLRLALPGIRHRRTRQQRRSGRWSSSGSATASCWTCRRART